jgi:hypothetical protein
MTRLPKRRSRFRRRIKTTSRYLRSKSTQRGGGPEVARKKTRPGTSPLNRNSPQTLLGGGGCCTPLAMPGRLSCKFGAIGSAEGRPAAASTHKFFSSSHCTLGDGTGALVPRRRCLPACRCQNTPRTRTSGRRATKVATHRGGKQRRAAPPRADQTKMRLASHSHPSRRRTLYLAPSPSLKPTRMPSHSQ